MFSAADKKGDSRLIPSWFDTAQLELLGEKARPQQ